MAKLKKEIEEENEKLRAELKRIREQTADSGETEPEDAELQELAALQEQIRQLQEASRPATEHRQEPERRYEESRGCGPVVMFVFVLLIFVVAIGGTIAGTVWFVGQNGGGGDDEDSLKPQTELVEQIEAALGNSKEAKEHAIYFAKACRGIGGRIETTYQKKEVTYDQRSEALALFGIGGEFMTAVRHANLYRGLVPFMESMVTDALEQQDGEVIAGEMTAEERAAFTKMWHDLADAFQEFSGAPGAFEEASK